MIPKDTVLTGRAYQFLLLAWFFPSSILISPNPFSATTEAGYIPDGMVTEPAFEVEIVDDLVKELPQDIIEIELEGVIEDAIEAGTEIK